MLQAQLTHSTIASLRDAPKNASRTTARPIRQLFLVMSSSFHEWTYRISWIAGAIVPEKRCGTWEVSGSYGECGA
jgi:hypothetical protein